MLRPELWPDEAPLEVAVPEVDGEVVDEGAVGQAMVEALLTEVVAPGELDRVSAGWGGDAVAVYRDGDLSCLRWDLRADSPTDLDELEAGLGRWIDRVGGGAVTRPVEGILRVDRCA